jgi:hypothetical protein
MGRSGYRVEKHTQFFMPIWTNPGDGATDAAIPHAVEARVVTSYGQEVCDTTK